MPIEGLSDRVRLPRLMKIRLGVRADNANGVSVPREVDYFVLKPEDFVSPDIYNDVVAAYGDKPKQLKMVSPFEVDSVNPADGEELIYNLYNRTYGAGHGLRCKGTGGSEGDPGWAVSTDKDWAKRIADVTREPATEESSGRFRIRCLGRDCCKYAGHDGKDTLGGASACRQILVFRASLLHPTDDPKSPDYGREFGIAEIASTSYNTAIDIRSGLRLLGTYAKRTAAIPFWLVRHPRQTNHDGKRQVHYTCMVIFSAQEVRRAGLTAPSELFLTEEVRAELKALGEPDYDSVRDLLPSANDASAPEPRAPRETVEATSTDRDEVVAEAAPTAITGEFIPAHPDADPDDLTSLPPVDEAAEQRQLTQAERDELKALCGQRVDPADPKSRFTAETIQRLQELAERAHAALGTEPGPGKLLTHLQLRHARWIREELAREGAAVQEALV